MIYLLYKFGEISSQEGIIADKYFVYTQNVIISIPIIMRNYN